MTKNLSKPILDDLRKQIIDAPGRENEINVYKVLDSDSDTGRTFDWINSRPTETTKMPAKFKKWKKSKGL